MAGEIGDVPPSPAHAGAAAASTALFAGGGEMGRVMAGRDWASTPIGSPETWPASLRSVVRILLTSRFSMWMGWGRELTFFYNDAYHHDTLRAKHPWALGQPAREVWAEIWDDIGPRIESVLRSGVATWDEDLLLFLERSGYPEETYHTFSYSPLNDEDGDVAGLLCVVTEDTDRVLSERRMATLRDLAAAVAATRTKQDMIDAVGQQLSHNPRDLPFSLTYLFDDAGTAHLACATGIQVGAAAAPRMIARDDPGSSWPVSQIRAGQMVVVGDLDDRFEQLPGGAWTQPPIQAAAVPLAAAQGQGPVAGFLVAALNPFRRFDDRYRGFVELVASQITSGLVNAGVYEAERRRAEALAELDRVKTDFFSNVSHEFRTPLTLIMGPVQELRTAGAVDPDRLRAELDVIHRNGLRLGKLVNTLLDFSRLQAGRIQAHFEPVDLAAFTTELASVFRSAVERAGLDYIVECPPLPEPVYVDRDCWEKIVLNLLSNALKFTFAGGITVALQQVDGSVELTVADTGTGIPAEQLPRLFERFHRVEGARARSGEGSGIGLAMVRELVGLHGGQITARSTLEIGTTFTVTLPPGRAHLPTDQVAVSTASVAVSAAAEPFVAEALRWLPATGEPPAQQRPVAPAEGRNHSVLSEYARAAVSGRVLVADDNADMREYLQRLLSSRYAVDLAGDGKAALTAALAAPPDLIVADVMMPGLDGMELLAALRGDARTARVPVLLLSARAGQEAEVEGLAAGADDYLVKPFTAAELLARVGAHLRLGRVRREAEARFAAMADLAPALIWVADASGARVFLNSGWRQFTGRDSAAELREDWRSGLHAQDRQRYLDTTAAAMANGQKWEIEYRLRRADGAYHWLLEHAVPIAGDDGGVTGYVGSCTDINARYRETERQTLLAQVSGALDREVGVEERLGKLARLMVDTRLADLCTVRLVDGSGQLHRAGAAALDAESEAALAELPPESSLGREVIATGRAVLRPDLPGDWPAMPGPKDPAQAALQRRLAPRSALAVPLIVRTRVLAVLVLSRRADAPRYTADDLMLIEEIAGRAALAVDNALLLAQERATAARLTLLQGATAKLSAVATPVQVASTAVTHLRQLLGSCQLSVFELDAQAQTLTALALHGVRDQSRWATISLHAPAPVATAVRDERIIWIEDLADWQVTNSALVEVMDSVAQRSGIALPLIAAGRAVGAIGISFTEQRRLSPDERATLLALIEPCAQALDRARLYRAEHQIADALQRGLLPQQLPKLPRLALAARYLPGTEGVQAGGDWYDVIELDTHRVAIAVGDVVGQGPAAAAVMGQLRTVLAGALRQGHNPAAALEVLDSFASWIPGARASTAVCLILDWDNGEARWARAGHLPPLLVNANGTRYLEPDGHGPILGFSPGQDVFTEGVTVIEPGTTLVLYTDGLVERRGEVVDEGLDRLAGIATKFSGTAPSSFASQLLEHMLTGRPHADDIALICARLFPPPLRLTAPAQPAELSGIRRQVRAWSACAGLAEDLSDDLVQVIDEATANCAEHAYPDPDHIGDMHVELTRTAAGAIAASITDFGRWRPVPADSGYRGRGLQLIRTLSAHAEIDGGASGTTVRLELAPPA